MGFWTELLSIVIPAVSALFVIGVAHALLYAYRAWAGKLAPEDKEPWKWF